jgi:hypothetical protein
VRRPWSSAKNGMCVCRTVCTESRDYLLVTSAEGHIITNSTTACAICSELTNCWSGCVFIRPGVLRGELLITDAGRAPKVGLLGVLFSNYLDLSDGWELNDILVEASFGRNLIHLQKLSSRWNAVTNAQILASLIFLMSLLAIGSR